MKKCIMHNHYFCNKRMLRVADDVSLRLSLQTWFSIKGYQFVSQKYLSTLQDVFASKSCTFEQSAINRLNTFWLFSCIAHRVVKCTTSLDLPAWWKCQYRHFCGGKEKDIQSHLEKAISVDLPRFNPMNNFKTRHNRSNRTSVV
mmetsp:Transcript_77695/g.157801  ORF Transcript_77695/g.157801 Transcript_77695/m.157801 type:complete len:144 (-) Transcript_77695:248-679(-)